MLYDLLHTHYAQWGITKVALIGEGLENQVYRVETRALGPVAIRVPRQRWYQNDNDSNLDARALLRQEAGLANHLAAYGVPVPAVHALHLSDELDFLVSAFVHGDGTEPDPVAMGRVTRAIHDTPVPERRTVAQGDDLIATLAERIWRRAAVVDSLANVQLSMPNPEVLRSILEWEGARRSLLHMDMRPANLITRCSQIAAVVDWTNAMIGDPGLELARIAEYGHLNEGFLEGYGDPEWASRLPPAVEVCYRLDTAVMLAVVFLSEAPDPVLAARQVQRVLTLRAQLSGLAPG